MVENGTWICFGFASVLGFIILLLIAILHFMREINNGSIRSEKKLSKLQGQLEDYVFAHNQCEIIRNANDDSIKHTLEVLVRENIKMRKEIKELKGETNSDQPTNELPEIK